MLAVWLPLINGNKDNLGLINIGTATTSASIVAGKLGNCYLFTRTSHHLLIYTLPTELLNKINNHSFGVSAWVKSSSSDAGVWLSITYGIRFECNSFSLYNSSRSVGASASSGTAADGNWHHVAYTYNVSTNKMTCYRDGIEVGSANYTSGYTYASSWTNNINIARDPNNSPDSYYFNGCIQDVRIWCDECPTTALIKEISKGLVCHYTLGSDSVYEATTNIASSLTPVQNGGWGGMTITKKSNNCYHLKAAHTQLSWHTFVYTLPQDCDGLTITFSAYINNISTSNLNLDTSWLFIGQGNNGQYPTHGSATYTINQLKNNLLLKWVGTISNNSNRYLIIECWTNPISSGSTCFVEFDLSAILIEKKDHKTQYVDGTRSPGIIYDSSGYCYNTTINGTINPSADTVRYKSCIKFNGSSYASCFSPTAEAKTLSLWAYIGSSIPTYNILFADYKSKLSLGFYDSGTHLITSCSGTQMPVGDTSTVKKNAWNHFVVVNNGSRLLYVNGSPVTMSSNNYWNHSSDLLMIGKRADANDGFTEKISDIRLYTTALSADDVKDLYNLGALIS